MSLKSFKYENYTIFFTVDMLFSTEISLNNELLQHMKLIYQSINRLGTALVLLLFLLAGTAGLGVGTSGQESGLRADI